MSAPRTTEHCMMERSKSQVQHILAYHVTVGQTREHLLRRCM